MINSGITLTLVSGRLFQDFGPACRAGSNPIPVLG
jgi:hypothetical protein